MGEALPYVRRTKRRPSITKRAQIIAGICAFLALALVFGALLMTQQERLARTAAEAATYTPAPVVIPEKVPVVAFLGDSYVNGWRGVPADDTYTARAARELDVIGRAYGAGGIGYAVESPSGSPPIPTYVDDLVASNPSYVVVQGGLNDLGEESQMVRKAASQTFTELRAAMPDTPILVVGPFVKSLPASAAALDSRDAVAAAAQEASLPFVDPIAEGWLTGPALIDADTVHLTPEGRDIYATRLAEAIRANGWGATAH